MANKLDWIINNKKNNLSDFIEALSAFLDQYHVPHKQLNEFCLAIDEIITNILSYAFADKNTHTIHITTEVTKEAITAIISDDGVPFDPTKQAAPDITLPLETRPIGGLGIHLVRSFIDEISYKYENKQNVLRLTKKIKVNEDILMEISESIQDQLVILAPKGRIDSITSTDLDAKISDLIARGFSKIIVDFSATDFVSSAGLRILLMKEKQLRNIHGYLILACMSDVIEEIFEVSGFSSIFKIQKTLDTAINSLKEK